MPATRRNKSPRAIGRFITSVSDLDAATSVLLGSLVQMHGEVHDMVLHSIDFNRKREIIKSLALMAPKGAMMVEIRGLNDRADQLMSTRNAVAHGLLHTQGGKLIIGGLSLPAIAKYAHGKASLLEVSTLDGLAKKADAISERMMEIARALRPDQLQSSNAPP